MSQKRHNSERIYLRILEPSDASAKYCDWLNDEEANKYLETRKSSVEDVKNYIIEKQNDSNAYLFGIFDKETDKHIGNLKFEVLKDNPKRADFGILLGDKDFWGKGIGAEATQRALQFAFEDIGLESVELGVLKDNVRGQKAFEKSGFKTTEVIKDFTNHDGTSHDAIMMEVWAKDFNQK